MLIDDPLVERPRLTKDQMDVVIAGLKEAEALHEVNKRILTMTYGVKFDEFGRFLWERNKKCFCGSDKKFKYCHGKGQR